MRKLCLSLLMAVVVCMPAEAANKPYKVANTVRVGAGIGVTNFLKGASLQALKSKDEKDILKWAYINLGMEGMLILSRLSFFGTRLIGYAVSNVRSGNTTYPLIGDGEIVLVTLADVAHMFCCTLQTIKHAKKIAHNNKVGNNKNVNSAYAWTTFAIDRGADGLVRVGDCGKEWLKDMKDKYSVVDAYDVCRNNCIVPVVRAGLRFLHCYAKNRYIAKLAADHKDVHIPELSLDEMQTDIG